MKKFIFLIILLFPYNAYSNDIRDAVVGIYSIKKNDKVEQGTGFFCGNKSHIITNYHVIKGSKSIEVYYNGGQTTSVEIIRVIPEYDLSIIKINKILKDNVSLTPNNNIPQKLYKKDLIVIGYPRGLEKHYFSTKATNGIISSKTIKDLDGNIIFNKGIDIIPLDLTIYSGMSGSPVILGSEVIGVLSGSINEGGSISWAIPIDRISKGYVLSNVEEWPTFDLMNSNWRSVSKKFEKSKSLPEIDVFIEKYNDNKNIMSLEYNKFIEYSHNYDTTLDELESIAENLKEKNELIQYDDVISFEFTINELSKNGEKVNKSRNKIIDMQKNIVLSISEASKFICKNPLVFDEDFFDYGDTYIKRQNELLRAIKKINSMDKKIRAMDKKFSNLFMQSIELASVSKQQEAFGVLNEANELRRKVIFRTRNLKYEIHLYFEYFNKFVESYKYSSSK